MEKPDTPEDQNDYVLGHSENELERLRVQARLIDPITRQFLLEAGIRPGMRVLDVGSGAGDVAFLGAELVGREGEIVGIDRSATAVATARRRAREYSLNNVSFSEANPSTVKFERSFDVVMGRYVLMFQDDPIEMVRSLKSLVRPGGLLVFHEVDWAGARSFPTVPLYDQCCQWVVEVMRRRGVETRMGIKLHSTFLAAGLPAPMMRLHSVIGGGAQASDQVHLKTDLAATLVTEIERLGIITERDLEIETLPERIMQGMAESASVIVGRAEIGAWANVQ